MSVFYFYFVEKMGNFHCDPCGGFVWKFIELGGSLGYPNFEILYIG